MMLNQTREGRELIEKQKQQQKDKEEVAWKN